MTHKLIFWDSDTPAEKNEHHKLCRAHVYLLVGYNQGTLEDFAKMAEELRRTFLQAFESEIRCGTVNRSSSMRGFTLVTWSGSITKRIYPGWGNSTVKNIDFSW